MGTTPLHSSKYEVPSVDEIEESVRQEQEKILRDGYNDLQKQGPLEISTFIRYDGVEIAKKVAHHPYAPEIR